MAYSPRAEWWRPVVAPGAMPPGAAPVRGHDSTVPFGALMVFTFILLLAPEKFVPELASVHITLVAGAFAFAAHCWTQFATRRPLTQITRELWLAGTLLAWAVATLPLSVSPSGSVRLLLDLFLKSLIIFWLLINTVTTLPRLRTVAWGLSLVAFPLAATGLWHFHIGLEGVDPGRIFGYPGGLTSDPNDLALALDLILPLTVALLLVSRRPVVRGLLVGLIVLDVSTIVVTFSRSGFLALATIFVLYLRRLPRGWAVAALVLAVAAVPFLPSGYLGRLGTITNIEADPNGSAQQRWALTRNALAYALSHPLVGAGLGMNIHAVSQLSEQQDPSYWPDHTHYVHNVYLEYAVDLGWPGLGLFLLLLGSCLGTAARVRHRSAGVPALREVSALAEAIWVTLMAFAVAALFYPVAYHYHFYYFAALAVAVGGVYAAEVRGPAAPANRSRAEDGGRP